MSRLIVVSNRVDLPEGEDVRAGGLAVALQEALAEGQGLWFGWSGQHSDAEQAPRIHRVGDASYATIDLPEGDQRDFYAGFSNGMLWPLFHYCPGRSNFHRKAFEAYLRVNETFARQLAKLVGPEDRIWVHDYHFIPLAAALRRLGLANRIGFFLHIPFPAPELLIMLPVHRRLMADLCAYDLIGFQTVESVQAFERYIVGEAGGRIIGDGRIQAYGRSTSIGAFPISIDTPAFAELARHAVHGREARRLKGSLVGRSLVIGVDRLDYSKGLPQRLEAFQTLLSRWPQQRGRVTLMQIAPVSRGQLAPYRALRQETEGLASRINGKFADYDWVPVRYLNKTFARSVLAGFYRIARVGLVTPIRDGMNLVAKEYVAAQDPSDPGVLVLSRFAGAARELSEALIVNPYDTDQVAAALQEALTMPREERIARWTALMEVLNRNTIAVWRDSFLAALAGPRAEGAARDRKRLALV
jgi:trehalose 6-phosphate synthase